MDKPQSKFWAGSSSSGSDSEESSSSEDEVVVTQKQDDRNKWQYESDSSEDDAQRIVKSAKHKMTEAFQKVHSEVRNSLNINDWNNISTLYTKLGSLLVKHADVIRSSTPGSLENYPPYYFLTLKEIQNAISHLSQNKAIVKKLSKTNGKSFNAIRARFKKLITEEYQQKN